MDITIYNELYKDFQDLYEQSKKVMHDSDKYKEKIINISQ